jgi:hypothetical protein
LARKTARTQDAAKKIYSATLMVHHRADSGIFDRNEGRYVLQPFGNAVNAQVRRTSVAKPVPSAASVRAPERAPRRRDVDTHAGAVAKHGNVRQASDQLLFRDLAISIRQVIKVKLRCGISESL